MGALALNGPKRRLPARGRGPTEIGQKYTTGSGPGGTVDNKVFVSDRTCVNLYEPNSSPTIGDDVQEYIGGFGFTVRALSGRLSALSVSHSKSIL